MFYAIDSVEGVHLVGLYERQEHIASIFYLFFYSKAKNGENIWVFYGLVYQKMFQTMVCKVTSQSSSDEPDFRGKRKSKTTTCGS